MYSFFKFAWTYNMIAFKMTKLITFRKLQNPNIIRCHGIFIEETRHSTDYLSIFMEVCNCSLVDVFLCDNHLTTDCKCNPYRRKTCHCFGENDRYGPEYKESFQFFTKISTDILNGLAFLHDQDFVHRNLKLSNILVSLLQKHFLISSYCCYIFVC